MIPRRAILPIIVFLLCASLQARAQKLSVSTNAADWANFGTANAELSAAVGRHWSVNISARYNPWTFGKGTDCRQNRVRGAAAGARWWPWNVYSGWWVGARGQWEEYNRGGFRSPRTEEGDAVGAALSAGYSLMLHPNVNIEFGAGLWGGWHRYKVYSCPSCGKIEEQGSGAFILPSDLLVSLVFTF